MTVHRLTGRVRHYDWGGTRYIPKLIGAEADGRPFAEYWLGAHPDSPSVVALADRGEATLDALIAADPGRWLGQDAARFENLPFLMKILDVAAPLSIQVHPDRAQARTGFEREEAEGIPRDARHRNFRDRNHKPELAVALEPFWLLYGFRPPAEIDARLSRYPSLSSLRETLQAGGVRGLFAALMMADEATLGSWLAPVYETVAAAAPCDPGDPAFWIRDWLGADMSGGRIDRGVLGFLVMNLLRLDPGQGIFQAANVPHAYLRGRIVEIMANSDNVLRCGLTSKHVDPAALLEHVDFSATDPRVIRGSEAGAGMVDYRCPADEFVLSRARFGAGVRTHRADSVEIWQVVDGRCGIGDAEALILESGQAAVVEPGTRCTVEGQPTATVFIARVPRR